MEGSQGRSQVDRGPGRQSGKEKARGWVMALALLGLGASALAPAAESGGDGAERYRDAMAELDPRRCPERHMNPRTESSPTTGLDLNGAMNGMDAGDGGQDRIEVVPVSVAGIIFPSRAEHYARACKPRGHLCDLIAAHARMGVARGGLKRVLATGPALSEEATPGWQDTSVASSAELHAPQRPE